MFVIIPNGPNINFLHNLNLKPYVFTLCKELRVNQHNLSSFLKVIALLTDSFNLCTSMHFNLDLVQRKIGIKETMQVLSSDAE